MISNFLIAITGAIAGLIGDPQGTAQGLIDDLSEPRAAAHGGPAPEATQPPASASSSPSAPAGDEAARQQPAPAAAIVGADAPPAPAPAEERAERRVAQAQGAGSSDADDSSDLSAAEVVEEVQSYYEDTQHLTAVFRQIYTNVTFGRESVSDGRVWLKKPGKMRWDYQNRRTGEVNKSFISDGSRLWALEHDNKQAFRKELEDTVLPVAVTFLTGEGKLSEDFRPSLDDSGTYGGPGDYVLRLVPKQPSAQYKTLWLVVDRDDFRAKQSIVLEASGNTNHFRFYEPNTERSVRDSWFEVDPRAIRGYRIIEPDEQ